MIIYKAFIKISAVIRNYIEKTIIPFKISKQARFYGAKTIIGKNVRIGKNCCFNFSRGAVLILEDRAVIEKNCVIVIYPDAKINIGANSYLGPGTEIYARSEIKIGADVLVAQNCAFIDYNHAWDVNGVKRSEFKIKPIEIGDNSWLGLKTAVLAGTKIGKAVIVGAQEVVRGEIPNNSLVIKGEIKNYENLNFN